jgi:hypothetical protein
MIYGACPNPPVRIAASRGQPAALPRPGHEVRRNRWPPMTTTRLILVLPPARAASPAILARWA